ncbi:MAG: hypothetical protein IPI66_13220 [Chitinophagaceae bacterium]|nr:hypothetical protein [Chitinophagaceae bacterium]MBL0056898.1 hypothetical protein [Chitinophagaceae bacterium]
MNHFLSLSLAFSLIAVQAIQPENPITAKPGLADRSCVEQSRSPRFQEWLKHTDDTTQITVSYPDTWKLKTSNEKTLFILTAPLENEQDDFNENMNMIVRKLPPGSENVTLADLGNSVESKTATLLDDYKLEYSKELQWNEGDAKEVSYTGKSKTTGKNLHFIQRITINQGRLILITYTAQGGREDIYLSTALKIFDRTVFN